MGAYTPTVILLGAISPSNSPTACGDHTLHATELFNVRIHQNMSFADQKMCEGAALFPYPILRSDFASKIA